MDAEGMDIDELPDELLLRIFSFIEDGVTLLDAVPFVCKRWLRVSRDPGAWTGVRVAASHCWYHCVNGPYPHNDGYQESIKNTARVVLHAPSLRSICTGSLIAEYFFGRYFISALRRSRCVVRELHWCTNDFISIAAFERAEVLRLLWRCRDSVRLLSVGHLLYCEKWSPPHEGDPTVLGVLAGLQHLEELTINVFPDTPYEAQLAAGNLLPQLRRLDFNLLNRRIDVPANLPSAALIAHLIRNSPDSRRHLRFENLMSPLPSIVRESVTQCTALRSVELGLLDVAAVRNMHQLHTLRLAFNMRDDLNPDALDLFSPITSTLQHYEMLRGLRRLEITTDDSSLEYSGSRWFQTHREHFRELLTALARFAAKAVTLSIENGPGWRRRDQEPRMEPPHPAEMMDYMPDLKAVHGDFTVDELPRLYALDLEEASGTIECQNPDDICKKLVEDFKKRGRTVSAVRVGENRVKFNLP